MFKITIELDANLLNSFQRPKNATKNGYEKFQQGLCFYNTERAGPSGGWVDSRLFLVTVIHASRTLIWK